MTPDQIALIIQDLLPHNWVRLDANSNALAAPGIVILDIMRGKHISGWLRVDAYSTIDVWDRVSSLGKADDSFSLRGTLSLADPDLRTKLGEALQWRPYPTPSEKSSKIFCQKA